MIPVVLLVGGLLAGPAAGGAKEEVFTRVLGGPPQEEGGASLVSDAVLGTLFSEISLDADDELLLSGDDALLHSGNPLSTALPSRDNVVIYKVQSGDNLSSIAAEFGVTLQTLYANNRGLKGSVIQPGQEIMILPVSGIIHQKRTGETIESIAALYGVSISDILALNPDPSADSFIIPGAEWEKDTDTTALANRANLDTYYMLPTKGWNWGRLHYNNGIDIANACGTQIFASAEGLVTRIGLGWDGGYGKNITIEHPNGTRTRYAHLQRVDVAHGDYVLQGDVLGFIGNTGNVHGPTGCHLHFEVNGARNPFVR